MRPRRVSDAEMGPPQLHPQLFYLWTVTTTATSVSLPPRNDRSLMLQEPTTHVASSTINSLECT